MKTIFITSYFTLIALIGNTQITDKNHIVNRDKNGIITSVDFNYSSTISDTATPSNPEVFFEKFLGITSSDQFVKIQDKLDRSGRKFRTF